MKVLRRRPRVADARLLDEAREADANRPIGIDELRADDARALADATVIVETLQAKLAPI